MLPTTSNRVQQAGNGTTIVFPFGYLFYDPTHLFVYLTDSFGNSVLQTLSTNYTVTGTGMSGGGTVTMLVAPPVGYTLTILRIVPLTQLQHYITGGDFPSASTEQVLDLLVMMCQQQQAQLNRALQTSLTENPALLSLPIAANRAGKTLAFDVNGQPIAIAGVGTWRGNWTTATAYNYQDIFFDPATNNIYLVVVAYVSGASVAVDLAAGDIVLLFSATSATATAVAAATTASAAATTASTAATSAAASASTAATYPVPPWVTAHVYSVNNTVIQSNQLYQCQTAHTSGTFATDLAAGKWLLIGATTVGVTTPMVGETRNLKGSGAGSAKTASWTVDEIVAKTALGGTAYLGAGLTLNFNGGGTGAGGMDTGATPTSNNLYVYAIYNPTTTTWSTLGTVAGTGSSVYGGANMPSGYTASCLIWSGVTDGSGNVQKFNQQDRLIFFPKVNVMTGGTATSYTAISLSAIVPANAKQVGGTTGTGGSGSANSSAIASDTSGTGEIISQNTTAGGTNVLDNFYNACPFPLIPILTAQNIYYKTFSSSSPTRIDVASYTI